MIHLPEVGMGSLLIHNKLKISISFILFAVCIFACSISWSAGYQEEKLFDGDFYSSEDLRRKVQNRNKEVQVLAKEIKALETDVDWLVLKINQIQDSGRTAESTLKKSITSKEKKITTLLKSKNRLESLAQYYSSMLDTKKEQELKEILRKKILTAQKEVKIRVEEIIPKRLVQTSKPVSPALAQVPVQGNGISKAKLQAAITQAGLNDWLDIIGTGTCLKIQTTLPILFPTGSAKVANEYKSFFKKLADFLKPYDVKVLVNGYADTVPIKNKKYPSNFELGATRAANIVHQFVQNGLKPSIFKIESTGKYRFAAKGMSKLKTLERRAEVTVIFSG